jgi:hypothetical protein
VSVIRGRFYRHLLSYSVVNGFMIILWVVASIAAGHAMIFWPIWTLLGWGLALGSHAIRVFGPQEARIPLDRRGDSWDRRPDPWGRSQHAGRHDRGPDDPRGRGRSRPRVHR